MPGGGICRRLLPGVLPKTKTSKVGSLLHLWNTLIDIVCLQVPSEEEYYQQEEFTHKRKPASTANKSKPMPPEHSLFVFSPTNFLRQKCHWLCNHSYFGNVVLLCIMVSSAMLAAEDPLNSQSPRNNVRHLSCTDLICFSTILGQFRL